MSVGEDASGRRRRVTPVARATLAALLVGTVACGSGGSPSDEASFGASSASASSTAAPTTAAPEGTPFPDGVYQWSLTPEDWTAAGLPADTEAEVEHHVVTFAGGTAYDIAVHRDGTRQPAAEWRYVPTGEQQISLTDEGGRTLTLEWELVENELHLTMEAGQGEPRDHVLWTAQPLHKVG